MGRVAETERSKDGTEGRRRRVNGNVRTIEDRRLRLAQRATTLGLVLPSSCRPAPKPERVSFDSV